MFGRVSGPGRYDISDDVTASFSDGASSPLSSGLGSTPHIDLGSGVYLHRGKVTVSNKLVCSNCVHDRLPSFPEALDDGSSRQPDYRAAPFAGKFLNLLPLDMTLVDYQQVKVRPKPPLLNSLRHRDLDLRLTPPGVFPLGVPVLDPVGPQAVTSLLGQRDAIHHEGHPRPLGLCFLDQVNSHLGFARPGWGAQDDPPFACSSSNPQRLYSFLLEGPKGEYLVAGNRTQ